VPRHFAAGLRDCDSDNHSLLSKFSACKASMALGVVVICSEPGYVLGGSAYEWIRLSRMEYGIRCPELYLADVGLVDANVYRL
jgi:hypothetical protein